MKTTHTRKGKHVTQLPQPPILDKEGNEITAAIKENTQEFTSINKAKEFMRKLPQHPKSDRKPRKSR